MPTRPKQRPTPWQQLLSTLSITELRQLRRRHDRRRPEGRPPGRLPARAR